MNLANSWLNSEGSNGLPSTLENTKSSKASGFPSYQQMDSLSALYSLKNDASFGVMATLRRLWLVFGSLN